MQTIALSDSSCKMRGEHKYSAFIDKRLHDSVVRYESSLVKKKGVADR